MRQLKETPFAEAEQQQEVVCLHELFERQVDLRPEQLALICGEVSLTYDELEQQSNQLARYLRELWVGPGKLVGLYFDRSEKPIIAILAILKAGAAYVPIDPAFPLERAKHILTEAEVSVLLTEKKLAEKAEMFFGGVLLAVDANADCIAQGSTERLSRADTGVAPDDLCYVLYTSGTTGRPKGVMTEHRNVVRFTASFNEVHGINHTDRVFHGFSLGFDGSVEEMWMAFSNGATLVVGTSEVVRFGDEVARVFGEQQVTVFSTVPTFLSMISLPMSSLRLIIVSGEPCPPDLVQRWAGPGLRMLNVYGPTETTVNTTVAECLVGRPVTIGRPLRGYHTYILDEQMQPAPVGRPGELYIGGVGVARGYFNQPELTAKQFVPNPFFGSDKSLRLYRTGDLVTLTHDGDLQFLQRTDNQVKIRGYRIELAEIESVLREHEQVNQAVVNVIERGDLKQLAAYVVTPYGGGLDRSDVLQWLRNHLPAYMVPTYLDVIEAIPMLASGKADRTRLPEPRTALVSTSHRIVPASNELEETICEAWAKLFKVSQVSCEDDFFVDLGGYSLLAAQLVTHLRNEHKLEVGIRDVYQHSTVKQLAAHIATSARLHASDPSDDAERAPRRSSREVFASVSVWTRYACYALQGLSSVLIYGVIGAPLLATALLVLSTVQGTISLAQMTLAIIVLIFLLTPATISLAVVTKWIVIGRYKAGEYPLWSFYYFRWWLVRRVQTMSGVDLYTGTPIMSFYYRLMGAKVGKNCILDTEDGAIFDLLTIGDDTCIGAQTQLLGYRVEGGLLKIGRIEIGSRCFVGTHCCLGLDSKMENDSSLDDLSLLPDGTTIPAGESRRGSPAEPAHVSLPPINEEAGRRRHPFLFGVLCFIAGEVVGELSLLSVVPSLVVVVAAYLYMGLAWSIASAFLTIPLGVVSFCIVVAVSKALILRRCKAGIYRVESWYFLRKWAADALLSSSGHLISILCTTIYLPIWLRMLGANVGRRAEISTVTIMTPDMMVIGDESFFADGSMVGGRRFFRGHVHVGINYIGRRSFVGNNAILPIGASLGDGCLLGVMSAVPGGVGATAPDGTEWLGSPPFQLPYRQKVEGFDISETFEPTLKLYILRCIIDAMRIILPIAVGVAAMMAYFAWVAFAFASLPAWMMMALTPLITTAIALSAALSVVLAKNTLMGTFKPVIKPLWSVYVWLNEVVNGIYEGVGLPVLSPLMGTPFFSSYLRLLGCKVGKHAFLETGLLSEFDLVEIGDYVALNYGVVVQNHLFEDRIMKSSYLRIGNECSVGNMSIVLYDSEMQDGSSVNSLSLLMKGETLPPNSRWIGIPTNQVR